MFNLLKAWRFKQKLLKQMDNPVTVSCRFECNYDLVGVIGRLTEYSDVGYPILFKVYANKENFPITEPLLEITLPVSLLRTFITFLNNTSNMHVAADTLRVGRLGSNSLERRYAELNIDAFYDIPVQTRAENWIARVNKHNLNKEVRCNTAANTKLAITPVAVVHPDEWLTIENDIELLHYLIGRQLKFYHLEIEDVNYLAILDLSVLDIADKDADVLIHLRNRLKSLYNLFKE